LSHSFRRRRLKSATPGLAGFNLRSTSLKLQAPNHKLTTKLSVLVFGHSMHPGDWCSGALVIYWLVLLRVVQLGHGMENN